jgi:hypothetical protein
MPFCRKCGAQLDEDARFCRKCGTPVEELPVSAPPPINKAATHRKERKSVQFSTAILVGILLIATLSIITLVPIRPVDSTQSYTISQANINRMNIDFDADVADVNVFIKDLPDQLVLVDMFAKGTVGIFASDPPIELTVSNETANQAITVKGEIAKQNIWPLVMNLQVTCNIYVDYSAVLNFDIKTNVGDITMNEVDGTAIFQGLNLQTTTGNVEANITSHFTIERDVSISTTTGNAKLLWNNANVSDHTTINVKSTTGRVTTQVSQNTNLGRNVSLNAQTTTGNVNLDMKIGENVGAQITSHTSTGQITLDANRFDGFQSPIRSRNYPASSNFEVTLETTTGNIHIVAQYSASSAVDQQEYSGIGEIYN